MNVEFRGDPFDGESTRRVHMDGIRKAALDTGRNRILATGVMFTLAFLVVAYRLFDIAILDGASEPAIAKIVDTIDDSTAARANIVDRNGMVLATSLPTASLYADPVDVLNPEEAARKLVQVLPELDKGDLVDKLTAKARFVWIKRNLTPDQQYEINRLGVPGLYFQRGERRVYPHGRLAAHLLGLTDVDGRGISGIEKSMERRLRNGEPARMSIDLRIQSLLTDELSVAMKEFNALGALGVVVDVRNGEILSLVSLPDFDPNDPSSMVEDTGFNRVTKGVYEMGSTFKLFTAAMALDTGTVGLNGGYDASKPIHVARYTISDYHGKNRWLSVPEILIYSSNIGAAKMGLAVGTTRQKAYLERFGFFRPAALEIPENGSPLLPAQWREINTMTVSFGHGIAVSPIQMAAGIAALVNGGFRHEPTLLPRDDTEKTPAKRVISEATSKKIRALMRLIVRSGTGKKADAEGYLVGGKTGTAEKLVNGRYHGRKLFSSFVAAFPIDAPRYVVLAALDEPHGNKSSFGYATGGWVAAPVISRVVSRMAPLMGIEPVAEDRDDVAMAPVLAAYHVEEKRAAR